MTLRSISAPPVTADCRCTLADGRILTITASRRPRANRADVKCSVPGAPALAEALLQAVRLARHTEVRLDSRDQVVLSMDIVPGNGCGREWELAAVLADRMVRGVYQHSAETPPSASGWSERWHLGQVSDGVVDGAPIGHLGALSGHADPAALVSGVRAWFPLHSGGVHDALAWVEVSVRALDDSGPPLVANIAADAADAAVSEEDSIAVPQLDLAAQQEVRQTLAASRHFDGRALGRWRTVVRFSTGAARFHGDSYQLALVMADRLARGREFVPRGRIIASGRSSAWHAGRVETVADHLPKLALIADQVRAGDRVLLPAQWQVLLPPGYAAGLRERGASLACIERIGMI
ncbi:MAG: hypothetical protein ABW202_18015 [Duganella sp.]